MAGRRWDPAKRGAAKDLNRWISEQMRQGKTVTVYTVRENATKISRVPMPPHVYASHTITSQSRFTGEWMTSHLSVSGLMRQEGIVYEKPPSGVPEIGDPGPQGKPWGAHAVDGWMNTNY